MSCDCAQCKQHYRTLGIAYGIPSEPEVEEAYREGIKQWHPDLYENYASLRADAEEHFKEIQVAYRGLKEHSGGAPVEALTERPVKSSTVSPSYKPEAAPFTPSAPSISFRGAPGCETAPFTPEAEEVISANLGKLGAAVAIVDLARGRSRAGSYSQFLLLGSVGFMVRDSRNMVSLLWYKDLGEVRLVDKQKQSKPGLWQKLAGGQTGYLLEIYRNNGTPFFSLTDQVDDSVKKVIYDFLLSRK
ncbi:MAG: DnaJ domain-containing protein [Terracidiphilus sp.]|jgi:hypothetical protein